MTGWGRVAPLSPSLVVGRITFRQALKCYRVALCWEALQQTKGNKSAAARLLGIHLNVFGRNLKALIPGEEAQHDL